MCPRIRGKKEQDKKKRELLEKMMVVNTAGLKKDISLKVQGTPQSKSTQIQRKQCSGTSQSHSEIPRERKS